MRAELSLAVVKDVKRKLTYENAEDSETDNVGASGRFSHGQDQLEEEKDESMSRDGQ